MLENLTEQVTAIWAEKINTPKLTLQMLADAVSAWEKLFFEQYGKLNDQSSREMSDALGSASRILISTGYFGAAVQLLENAWKETGKKQREVDCKIYRAGIAFYLSEIYLQQGDRGAACWWQLHALADDYLEGSDGGGAKIVLETILGVPKGLLFENLRLIAVNHRNICQQSEWKREQGFAEDIITEFVIAHPENASIFAYPTSEAEFPISPGYLSVLCKGIEDDTQGKRLEYIACYLFLHIPGCTPAHDLLDEDKTMQMDVVVRNLTPQGNLAAETFGRHFGIECKNWAKPIGSPECGYFLHRIHLLHFNFGVMLAREGITGSPKGNPLDEEAARQLIRRTFHEDGVTCIVLSYKDHLLRLINESTTLRAILFEEIELFRFGKSHSANQSL